MKKLKYLGKLGALNEPVFEDPETKKSICFYITALQIVLQILTL